MCIRDSFIPEHIFHRNLRRGRLQSTCARIDDSLYNGRRACLGLTDASISSDIVSSYSKQPCSLVVEFSVLHGLASVLTLSTFSRPSFVDSRHVGASPPPAICTARHARAPATYRLYTACHTTRYRTPKRYAPPTSFDGASIVHPPSECF